jgi:5-methylcytosine-specific restriction endonuclease McrA
VTDPFYASTAWRAARLAACRRAHWRCEWCGADCRAKGASRVDHRRPRLAAPALALEPTNLRLLCPTCDNRRHADKGGARPLAGADRNGWPTAKTHHWNLNRKAPRP